MFCSCSNLSCSHTYKLQIILTVVTFHLHKRVARHQANKNFHTMTYLKIKKIILGKHSFFLYMAFKLLFLQKNYLFRKMSFWFPWSNLWKLSARELFFRKVFGNFTKKVTPPLFSRAHFFTERYQWLFVFVKIKARNNN